MALAAYTSVAPATVLDIATLSNRPNLVSGGDVLVQITTDGGGAEAVTLNGADVSAAFRPGTSPNTLLGLVTGLNLGANTLAAGGKSLVVTNYPIKGPIISGPYVQPFICTTQTFRLPDGTTLGEPTDADCSAPTKISYVYMPLGGTALLPLPSTSSLPNNVAMTTTLNNEFVPFVVRVETGTMDRGIYQNAVLHDPTAEPVPTPFSPPRGWNRRLLAQHGSGCPGGWYVQGAAQGVNILTGNNLQRLGEGWGVFINTLQHPANSCNATVAGEATMMGKERFIETFGVPTYTLSTGGSGGAITSEGVGDAFPGLFDGILISAAFPDTLSIPMSGADGHLLAHYFTVTNPTGFTIGQQVAVSGYQGQQAWYDAANQSGRIDPVPGRVDIPGYSSAVWNALVPAALRYDPVTNPTGARPTMFDWARNIYGRDPVTGFGLRPYDNVGVQYGLGALNAGAITTTQFLDLNQGIGGVDQDFNYIASRAVGDPGAIRRAYQAGLSMSGNGGLKNIPVIDMGSYNDTSGYHYQWYRFAVRERLREANGEVGNHVMWRGSSVPFAKAWFLLNMWVNGVKADRSDISEHQKVLNHRPPSLVDGCWPSNTQFVAEPQTLSSQPNTTCNAAYPSWTNPRFVAGGPIQANIYKCQLKPINPADYKVAFSQSEITRLNVIFPNGVCDWSKPGVNQTGVVTWPSFGPSQDNLVSDKPALSFFVSSATSATGNLGGLTGADATCQRLGAAAGEGARIWRAYLSVERGPNGQPVNARDRIGSGPWYNANLQLIANNLSELHARSGDAAVFVDERGQRINGQWTGSPTPVQHDILTGSNADGTVLAGATCSDWTSAGTDVTAQVGHSDGMGPNQSTIPPLNSWNSAHTAMNCSNTAPRGGAGRIYCFAP